MKPTSRIRAGLCVQVSRLCLLAAYFLSVLYLFGSVLFVLVVLSNVIGIVLLIGVLLYLTRKRSYRGTGWAYGTAAWATPVELAQAGLFGSQGLLIGTCHGLYAGQATRLLLAARSGEIEPACRLLINAFSRKSRSHAWVRLSRSTHIAVFAPTGRGKSSGVAIPNLMTMPQSMVVVDPKGELAKSTAAIRRQRFGHRVVILDPFRIVTATPDTFNPLDWVSDGPLGLDDAKAIAEALVVKTGLEKEPHWTDSAELWLWTIIAYVLHEADPETRNLQTVAQILADPILLKAAVQVISESDAWDGMLCRLGLQLGHYIDRELGSTLTTTNRFLRFANTLAVAESTSTSSFDPSNLRRGRMTVYLVLPTEYLRSQTALLRLWINGLLRSMIAGGTSHAAETWWLLDEAAAIGHLDAIDDAVERLRGYGVRLCFFYQSVGQLELCFPGGRAQTFLSNMDQVYFGVNDTTTANAVSERLGTGTIVTYSENGGSNVSRNDEAYGQQGATRGSNSGYSVAETGRKLLLPDEVAQLSERRAIVFASGTRPFVTELVRHYERAFRRVHGGSRFGLAVRSLLLLLFLAIPGIFAALVMSADLELRGRMGLSPERPALLAPGTFPRAYTPLKEKVDVQPQDRIGPPFGVRPTGNPRTEKSR